MRPIVSLVLLCLLAVTVPLRAQSEDRESRRLPVSLTLSADLFLYPGLAGAFGLLPTGTASFRVSRRIAIGLAYRSWASMVNRERCSVVDDECLLLEDADATAGFAQVTAALAGNELLFGRLGVGPAFLREQTARGLLIQQRRSWSAAVLAGIGLHLQVREHLFTTPTVEVIRTFYGDDTLRATRDWQIRFGFGLTVR
jgi:hypothetical protein